MRTRTCIICTAPVASAVGLCTTCAHAWDTRRSDGTIMEIVEWTAARARRNEKRIRRALERVVGNIEHYIDGGGEPPVSKGTLRQARAALKVSK